MYSFVWSYGATICIVQLCGLLVLPWANLFSLVLVFSLLTDVTVWCLPRYLLQVSWSYFLILEDDNKVMSGTLSMSSSLCCLERKVGFSFRTTNISNIMFFYAIGMVLFLHCFILIGTFYFHLFDKSSAASVFLNWLWSINKSFLDYSIKIRSFSFCQKLQIKQRHCRFLHYGVFFWVG
jgi:hypothetical protein